MQPSFNFNQSLPLEQVVAKISGCFDHKLKPDTRHCLSAMFLIGIIFKDGQGKIFKPNVILIVLTLCQILFFFAAQQALQVQFQLKVTLHLGSTLG